MDMTQTSDLLDVVIAENQDFEWYPTTPRMIEAVKRWISDRAGSIMDIGAGDGRVLAALAKKCPSAELYAIEKATVLVQAQPDNVIPVGTDFHEQNLSCLQVGVIFCNPPYSQFEPWAVKIIDEGFADKAFMVLPRRWADSKPIKEALKRRGAASRVIHKDDFQNAERQARAVVDIVEILYPRGKWDRNPADPFDTWFDQNISTFDEEEEPPSDYEAEKDLARKHSNSNIGEMVTAYVEEYSRMEANYRAIFKLDHALLRELGVSKENVREGIKKKMAGLKVKYWQLLFGRIGDITSRLTVETCRHFIEKLTGRQAVAFTASNAYAVILWAVKNANKYYDEQLITHFRELSNADSVKNYKSNQRTWQNGGWRWRNEGHTHYALDYRFVVPQSLGISKADGYYAQHHNGLYDSCHDFVNNTITVLSNLGFALQEYEPRSRDRQWVAGKWQDFRQADGKILFQAKAHLNGNVHFRFMPKAIRRLNIEAGRLLGWLQTPDQAATELGYDAEEVKSTIEYMVEDLNNGMDPEEILYENGLEPDFVFDLLAHAGGL